MAAGTIADAFAAVAAAASGVGGAGVVAAADPSTLSAAELEHMDSLEVENSGEIEMNGVMYAVEYMGDHWKMLTGASSARELVLSGDAAEDERLYREFRAAFGAMDVRLTKSSMLKDPRSQETWRAFMMAQDGRMEEFNMISLLRIDAALGYDDDNTLLVPRVQFLAIEIARNREGVNDCAKLRELATLLELKELKTELQGAMLGNDSSTAVSLLKQLAADYPILPRSLLQQSGLARYIHTRCAAAEDPVLAATAKSLERQWKSGVVMSRLCKDARADVSSAAQYVVERWQGLGKAGSGVADAAALAKGGAIDQTRLGLDVSDDERTAQRLSSETVDAAVEQFERDGVMYIESALHPKLLAHAAAAVDGCCDFLSERLHQLGHTYAGDTFAFAEVQYRDGARLDNRLLIEQTVCGSELIAHHPLWYPVVEKLLTTKSGGEPQLLFAGVVDAYPYDRPHAQEWHRDGQALSPEPSAQLQPHCINLFIPLVDITEDVGPTEFWPGTHVEATYHALQKEQKVTQTPTPEATPDAATATILAPAGSIILFDYRTIHRGGANTSGKQRRVLYLTYATKSFTDAKNFSAPSILDDEPGRGACMPQQVWEEGGMAAFRHVLRLRQLGMTVPRSWCDVGNDLYTSRFGLLLASAYLRNEQLAFDPAKYTDDGVSAEAEASALLNAAEDPAAWAQLMSADKDDSTLPHDVALLCNAAACSRFERRAADIEKNVRKFVLALNSEEAQQARLACVESYFTQRHSAFTTGAKFVKAELDQFGGKKEGYCFGICKDGAHGLGYYLDAGPEEMHEDVRKELERYRALPPPPKHNNDTSGQISAGLDEVPDKVEVELDEHGRGCAVETDIGRVELGQLCTIMWEYEEFEAEAVKIDAASLAITWRYTPSPHWDEWSESIPLVELVSRGLVLKEGKTGKYHLVVQKQEAEAEAAAVAAAAAAPLPADIAVDVAGVESLANATSEVADFADVGVDAVCSLQLEALAVTRTTHVLQEYGFTVDGAGFRALVATAKSVSAGQYSADVEEVITGWMHGGVGRLELQKMDNGIRVDTLVVVFSSLGNGVIRPEFRGTLKQPGNASGVEAKEFDRTNYDVLYVLDPARSWYSQDPGCTWSGFEYFESEISKVVESGGYRHVLMMGDSMGGSGALLFAHLATRVLAFVPQCELERYPMCTRRDFTAKARQAFSARLLNSVLTSSAHISVHLGMDDEDERQLQWLLAGIASADKRVAVVRYPDISGHHVSGSLKESGELKPLVQGEIIAATAVSLS